MMSTPSDDGDASSTTIDVLFALNPEWGSTVPGVVLAGLLRSRGYRCGFVLPDDSAAVEGVLMAGQFSTQAAYVSAAGLPVVRLAPFAPVRTPWWAPWRFVQGIDQAIAGTNDSLDRICRRLRPGLFVADHSMPNFAIAPLRLGITVRMVFPCLYGHSSQHLPPVTSGVIPRNDASDAPRLRWAWRRCKLARLVENCTSPTRAFMDWHVGPLLCRLLTEAGCPTRRDGEGGATFSGVESVMLVPAAFDFAPRPGMIYLPGMVDADPGRGGQAVDGELGTVLARRPVYATLGSRCREYGRRRVMGCFRNLIACFRDRPHDTLVLGLGDAMDPEALGALPANVLARRWLPQAAVLAQSRILITNAGMNTVKEAIACRVPIIALPAKYDQPGNAARIAAFNLGRRADLAGTTASGFAALIDAVDGDPAIAGNLERMRAALLDHAARDAVLDRWCADLDRGRGTAEPGGQARSFSWSGS